MQSQLMAMLTIANGKSTIIETVFESRDKHVSELNKLGANIVVSPDKRNFTISGVKKLHGTIIDAKDLRGGAALILAGIAAEGHTIVRQSQHIERGYEQIDAVLRSLGVDIQHHFMYFSESKLELSAI